MCWLRRADRLEVEVGDLERKSLVFGARLSSLGALVDRNRGRGGEERAAAGGD